MGTRSGTCHRRRHQTAAPGAAQSPGKAVPVERTGDDDRRRLIERRENIVLVVRGCAGPNSDPVRGDLQRSEACFQLGQESMRGSVLAANLGCTTLAAPPRFVTSSRNVATSSSRASPQRRS